MSTTDYGKYYDEQMKGKLNEELAILDEQHKADVLETKQAYQGAINMQNVQRLINERKIAESMANAGLTDSGLNRTQQTATQLSYSNAVAQLELEKQKKVDSLALALRQQKNALETNYQAGKAEYVQEAQKIEQEAIKNEAEAAAKQTEKNKNAYKEWMEFKSLYDAETDPAKQEDMFDEYLNYHYDDPNTIQYALANGYEWGGTDGNELVKKSKQISTTGNVTEVTNSKGEVSSYKTIRRNATVEGAIPPETVMEELEAAFKNEWDINEYLEACKRYPQYSTAYMDILMTKRAENDEKLAIMWALATENSTEYNDGIVETSDYGGKRGGEKTLDRNAKIKINGEEKTVAQWHRYLKKEIGLTAEESRKFLLKFGGDE